VLHWQTLSSVLSGFPSQSLSFGDVQSRVVGPADPVHIDHTPPVQVCVPALQTPLPSSPGWTPQGCIAPLLLHWHSASGVLSGEPLQSLSSGDVQSRGFGSCEPTQADHVPFVLHVSIPG